MIHKIFSTLLVILLLEIALVTTGLAMYKVSSNGVPSFKEALRGWLLEDYEYYQQQENVAEESGSEGIAQNQEIEARDTVQVQANSVNEVSAKTVAPATKSAITTNNSKCIVTISGAQYDVTNLRFTHSGGNVFRCGADMTAAYNAQHGGNLALISRYRVGAGGGATAPSVGGGSYVAPVYYGGGDDDDDDHYEYDDDGYEWDD